MYDFLRRRFLAFFFVALIACGSASAAVTIATGGEFLR
jgi:hypothetical protein